MTHESYKAWLEEMPIDDVRRKIGRLERKLADLHVLERLYDERHGGGEAEAGAAEAAPDETAPEAAPAPGEDDRSESESEAREGEDGEG
ncbi:MAG: hypothetical protein ABSF58_01000 [Solirubrobacteraceae bacterium]|jgi:hypothetical protein